MGDGPADGVTGVFVSSVRLTVTQETTQSGVDTRVLDCAVGKQEEPSRNPHRRSEGLTGQFRQPTCLKHLRIVVEKTNKLPPRSSDAKIDHF